MINGYYRFYSAFLIVAFVAIPGCSLPGATISNKKDVENIDASSSKPKGIGVQFIGNGKEEDVDKEETEEEFIKKMNADASVKFKVTAKKPQKPTNSSSAKGENETGALSEQEKNGISEANSENASTSENATDGKKAKVSEEIPEELFSKEEEESGADLAKESASGDIDDEGSWEGELSSEVQAELEQRFEKWAKKQKEALKKFASERYKSLILNLETTCDTFRGKYFFDDRIRKRPSRIFLSGVEDAVPYKVR